MIISDKTKSLFWAKVKKTETCWLWTAGGSMGYGQMRIKRKGIRSHQISWMIHRGEIPDGLCVLHNCPGGDNRKCVNPDHLWLGTSSQNIKDAESKNSFPIGNDHWKVKIPDEELPTVFALKKQGLTQTEIGRRFGVGQDQISRIVNGKRRKKSLVKILA